MRIQSGVRQREEDEAAEWEAGKEQLQAEQAAAAVAVAEMDVSGSVMHLTWTPTDRYHNLTSTNRTAVHAVHAVDATVGLVRVVHGTIVKVRIPLDKYPLLSAVLT